MSDSGQEKVNRPINIASRIKQFSSTTDKIDSNGNVKNAKPNPVPRCRHHTEEINSILIQKPSASKSLSSPPSQQKPVVPTKPNSKLTIGQTSPLPVPRPLSVNVPKSLKPLKLWKPPDLKNDHSESIKPKLPLKPDIIKNIDNSVQGASVAQAKTINNDRVSWKQTLGPPKRPVPAGPSNNPPKPLRGRERLEYENNDIDPKCIKNKPQLTGDSERRDTLDGQLVLGPSSTVRSSVYDEVEAYDYPYELPTITKFRNVPTHKFGNLPAEYETADLKAVQGFMNSLASKDQSTDDEAYDDPDDEAYQDPDKLDTKPWQDSDSSDYEEPSEDAHKPVHTKINEDIRNDSEDYEMPDDFGPPPVPKHQNGPVPAHKDHSQNNLESSSDEDGGGCPDYMDPESFFSKPPVNIYDTGQRVSHFTPAEYIPIQEIDPSIDEDDDQYVDPAEAFSYSPALLKKNKDHDTEEIYSDEPLYQVYNEDVLNEIRRLSKKSDNNDDCPASPITILHENKPSSIRMLWSELPAVQSAGFLDTIKPEERKRQEAMFEVISSEASYLKSLDILVTQFMLCKDFLPNPNMPSANANDEQILDRQQYHFLFTGISAIKAVSERFLKDLRHRQQQSVLINSISDIIQDYAENHFQCYVKYCSNQVFQDRTLQALLHSNPHFNEVIAQLEKDKACQGLKLQSFLILPMQRITRLPVLVDAICSRCEPGSEGFTVTDTCLKAVNILVHNANEGARKMVQIEEMYFIQKMLIFKAKPIPLISASRWLVKKGHVSCLHEEGRFSKYKNQLRQIFKGKCKPIYLFLFTDLVLVTKMKGDEHFKVIDYCQRSLLKIEISSGIPDPEPPKVGTLAINPLRYAFTLVLLENSNGKTVDYHFFLETETDSTRWLEAFNPHITSDIAGESIYEEWDCPQVQVIHPYHAQQSDELNLVEGDVISVLRKLPDGWAEGCRLRYNEKGWFPVNHTDEIDSRHMRAKNLMQRYRLLTASENIVNKILGK